MKVLIYSAKPFELSLLDRANKDRHHLTFTTDRLTSETAMQALNFDAISIFSADDASPNILEKLYDFGVRYITLRSAGYDNINLLVSQELGIKVANTPSYSPNAIAEHAMTLILALNRKIASAHQQILNYNFLLDDLIGFDLQNKTVGILGTGKIGSVLARILHGFDCQILANDVQRNHEIVDTYQVKYVSKETIALKADVIFICLPLNEATHHLFNKEFLNKMKQIPFIINIARGAIVHTDEILKALDAGIVSGYATDVYEHEHGVFFYDRSQNKPSDVTLHQLLTHPKTLVTPHQAFATREALENIASATFENLNRWEDGLQPSNELSAT
jgi:D-lactate dehydrogenase